MHPSPFLWSARAQARPGLRPGGRRRLRSASSGKVSAMEMEMRGSPPVCPLCSSLLMRRLRYMGEPVPEGAITVNVTPLQIAEIKVECEAGHAFTASRHTVNFQPYVEVYEGVRPVVPA